MPAGERKADERGAILLIALFFAVFMVGMVYYVIGVAEAVLLSERMQDAVDASALSGAVMSARGMNFIVLVNLVMSALLAILVALKLVETLCMVGMAIAAALAYPTFGLTLPFIPILEGVRTAASTAYGNLKTPIEEALSGLNTLSTSVGTMAPGAAKELAEEGVVKYWTPPVDCGTVAPSRLEGLPIEDDDYAVLCEKAGENVGGIIAIPFSVIDVPELSEAITGAMGGAAREFSDWFCGADGSGGSGSAPPIKTTVEHHYPRLELAQRCDADRTNETLCNEANAEAAEARPHDTTGRCQGPDCSIDGPYERGVKAARADCDPRKHPAPVKYWWQEQTGTVNWIWNGEAWERGDTIIEETVQRQDELEKNPLFFKPPCGPAHVLPMIVGYELEPHPNGDVNEINPVCSEGGGPPLLPIPAVRGEVYSSRFKRVNHILGCRIDVVEEQRGDEGHGPAASGTGRSPKKIIKDLKLGGEDFQIRAFARRKPRMVGPGRGVRVALWGADAPGSELGVLETFQNYAVAQAEYFYDGTEGESGWMWNMKWRGRLKRFRLPDDSFDVAASLSLCVDDGAMLFFATLRGVKDLVMH